MATPATIVTSGLPTVALIGRVNVGKSSLFNKIIEQQLAMVSDIPGTTRTRNIAHASWRGKEFRLVDTGGLTFTENVELEDDIINQTKIAIKEADVILFVVDIQLGLLPQELQIAKLLKKEAGKKPIILVANKADTFASAQSIYEREWKKLLCGEPFPVSAVNGMNIGDLLDLIYQALAKMKKNPKTLEIFEPIKVALMGKPNVGKSSLFNKLVGEDRVIVSPIAHTTREPHDTLVEVDSGSPEEDQTLQSPKQYILFIDTAGIRRKTKVNGELERLGISKSIATINRADIVLLVIDATEPITDQDQQLGGLLREHTKSVIIVINKWDQSEDNTDSFRNETKEKIYSYFPHLKFAAVTFVSAKTGYRAHQIFPLIQAAWIGRHTEIDQKTLDDFLYRAQRRHKPSTGLGVRHPKLLGIKQLRTNPPMFELFIKHNTSVNYSYVQFLENRLREEFNFFATPVIIKMTKMKK